MKIINPYVQIVGDNDGEEMLRHIERCGRVCYKSESAFTPYSAAAFVRRIIKNGHESVLEHVTVTMQFVVDRGVSHEIVRHRIASYSQESTRYCNYKSGRFGGEITVIKPCFWERDSLKYAIWEKQMHDAEDAYLGLIECGAKPEEARSVLPNSLKTEIMVSMNLREWRHFFRLRTAADAHPQMREIALLALYTMKMQIPAVFDDIVPPEEAGGCADACDISEALSNELLP